MRTSLRAAMIAVCGLAGLSYAEAGPTRSPQLKRGEYLATIMDCSGCHTPGALTGKPDARRPLAGSDVGFQIPSVGIFYPPNLTPDAETGLGRWSEADIVKAVRTGVGPARGPRGAGVGDIN